jgi:hypothetical protein
VKVEEAIMQNVRVHYHQVCGNGIAPMGRVRSLYQPERGKLFFYAASLFS